MHSLWRIIVSYLLVGMGGGDCLKNQTIPPFRAMGLEVLDIHNSKGAKAGLVAITFLFFRLPIGEGIDQLC